jgi:3-phosphoshikimate 1-carboxyvinyltransferase
MSLRFSVQPGGRLRGRIRMPGDKSVSHRAVMLGALAEGVTEVTGFLDGEDCLRTLQAFRAMGVDIERRSQTALSLRGAGLHGLKPPTGDLDLGNSGTSMRLMAGILSGQAFDSSLTGDESLRHRPMKRVTVPLMQMGACIDTSETGTAPLRIHGGQALHGIAYVMPVASAQVKSCLLLAGLYAEGETSVTEPAPSRDHTERMLAGFGYAVSRSGARVALRGGGKLEARPVAVPGDISSAAFFLVGAAVVPGSELIIENVGVNPTRTGVIEILRLMGAEIEVLGARENSGEPVADLRVRGRGLKGIRIPAALVPLAIDEFPAIFVAAACAEGETLLMGAEELRVKESDRIAVMAEGLRSVGIGAEPAADGIRIRGGQLGGGRIASHGDHRVAMAFAMAALRATKPLQIDDCANVNTSFPGFAALAAQAGLAISEARAG